MYILGIFIIKKNIKRNSFSKEMLILEPFVNILNKGILKIIYSSANCKVKIISNKKFI